MKRLEILLLSLTTGSLLAYGSAKAQVVLPQVELRGIGATKAVETVVQTLNCIGNPGPGLNPYGSGNVLVPVPAAVVGSYNCGVQQVQPDFEGKYLGQGSGAGRQAWRTFNVGPNVFGNWANPQFAISEVSATVRDLTLYDATANSLVNKAGPAIQVPFHVIPIAFAYNPVYGVNSASGVPVNMTFNVKIPSVIGGIPSGGLRLTRLDYCKIFNGEITNWNDPALKTRNGNLSLHDPVNDSLARWSTEGAQIRLIGRADRAGDSDVFTRAMAAQCNGLVVVNKFNNVSDSLPFDNTSVIDIRRLRPDARYFPGSAPTNFSGPIQSLGGLVYDSLNDVVCNWGQVNAATRQCDPALATGGVLTNTPTPGLFTVADGASGVAEAIDAAANNALVASIVNPNIKLNGKFGYVSADFVRPVAGRTLFSAALQAGVSATYVMPTPANATTAFGTVLPPQAIAASGAYSTADTRQVGSVDPLLPIGPTNPATPVSRANPLHWAAVLYDPNVLPGATLAAPAKGYPVTGVNFLLTYTCFKPVDPTVPGNNAKRFGMVEFIGVTFGKITKDSANVTLSSSLFRSVASNRNIALPSTGWVNAINDTFLKKSTGTQAALGNLNLWIQDTLPTTVTDVDNIVQATDSRSNPACDPNAGA